MEGDVTESLGENAIAAALGGLPVSAAEARRPEGVVPGRMQDASQSQMVRIEILSKDGRV